MVIVDLLQLHAFVKVSCAVRLPVLRVTPRSRRARASQPVRPPRLNPALAIAARSPASRRFCPHLETCRRKSSAAHAASSPPCAVSKPAACQDQVVAARSWPYSNATGPPKKALGLVASGWDQPP